MLLSTLQTANYALVCLHTMSEYTQFFTPTGFQKLRVRTFKLLFIRQETLITYCVFQISLIPNTRAKIKHLFVSVKIFIKSLPFIHTALSRQGSGWRRFWQAGNQN